MAQSTIATGPNGRTSSVVEEINLVSSTAEKAVFGEHHKRLLKHLLFVDQVISLDCDAFEIIVPTGLAKIREVDQQHVDGLVQSFEDCAVDPERLHMRALVFVKPGEDVKKATTAAGILQEIKMKTRRIMPFTGLHRYYACIKYHELHSTQYTEPNTTFRMPRICLQLYNAATIDVEDLVYIGGKDNEVSPRKQNQHENRVHTSTCHIVDGNTVLQANAE